MCEEMRMVDLVSEFGDFKRMMNLSSKEIKRFMNNVFFQNEMTMQVQGIEWDDMAQENFVFGSKNSLLSAETIKTEIRRKKEELEKGWI